MKDFWKYAMIVWFKTFVNPLTSFARFSEEKTKGKKKRKRYEGITVTCKHYGMDIDFHEEIPYSSLCHIKVCHIDNA